MLKKCFVSFTVVLMLISCLNAEVFNDKLGSSIIKLFYSKTNYEFNVFHDKSFVLSFKKDSFEVKDIKLDGNILTIFNQRTKQTHYINVFKILYISIDDNNFNPRVTTNL